MLISTLREIFAGNKELFKGLWIDGSDYDWQPYPVIFLNFSALSIETSSELKISLSWTLEKIAESHGIKLSKAPLPGLKLELLIKTLGEKSPVVILIDEYDYPLINNLDNLKIADANRRVLKNFFSVLKSLDEYLKVIFITGVTKFSKTSLFSGLNNLNDLTVDPRAATLLGYSHEEIKRYFTPYVEQFSQHTKVSVKAILDEMETWYNGYRFSEDPIKVFNPFSVLYYFTKEVRANYWIESGTPQFLIELLKKQEFTLEDITIAQFSDRALGTFDVDAIPIIPILFQTGYLTISNYDAATQQYQLSFPNTEIRESFKKYLLVAYSHTDIPTVERVTSLLSRAIKNNDIPEFCVQLRTLFANIPFQLHISEERYYHSLFQVIGSLLSLDIQSEVSTDKGRIDLVLTTKTHVYIFELKYEDSAENALKQIESLRYYERYQSQKKKIMLVGLSISRKKKKLVLDCISKEL